MAEHFYAYGLPRGSANMVALYGLMYFGHLLKVEFTRQICHIGKLGIELQCLGI